MDLKKISLPLKGFLSGILMWSCAVVFAWGIYPIKPEGFEGAGFLLLFLGLPSSILLSSYNGPVIMQVLLLSLLGYLQWPLLGLIVGSIIRARKRKKKKASSVKDKEEQN